MMQAGVRVTITATSNGVTAIRRNEPMPVGALNQGELLDKADFRPMTSGRVKETTALGGVVLRARAPRWTLNPITARAEAPEGSIILTKAGGDPLGQWGGIGIRPAFEWCVVLPQGTRLTSEPDEINGTLVAFLPNGGDVDENVRRVIRNCTIADLDRVRAIYAASAAQAGGPGEPKAAAGPLPVTPPNPGPTAGAPPRTPPPGGATPGGSASPPPRGGPPSGPPPRVTPPRPNS